MINDSFFLDEFVAGINELNITMLCTTRSSSCELLFEEKNLTVEFATWLKKNDYEGVQRDGSMETYYIKYHVESLTNCITFEAMEDWRRNFNAAKLRFSSLYPERNCSK